MRHTRFNLLFATVVCIGLWSCKNGKERVSPYAETTPFTIGRIEKIHSNILGQERVLNVYLPEGFSDRDTTRYAVVYLLDGSAGEDFVHVSGIVQYDALPWINRLPPTIVIGIANIDRKHDFTYPTAIADYRSIIPAGGGSEKFMDFIEKELQPWVTTHFKTTATRVLIGQSLGGLLASEILLKRPRLFNKYIIMSPSLWWDDGSLLKVNSDILNPNYNQPTDVYVGVGKEGAGLGRIPHVMQADARSMADKIARSQSPVVKVYFDYLPSETHSTITHTAVFNAFRYLFKPMEQPH